MTNKIANADFNEWDARVDAGGAALRDRMQSGKTLRPWNDLPNSTKRKWRDYASIVLAAADRAAENYRAKTQP